MMAGQGDRSGKKPKYTIRDIGGVELSSEDKPTERVLNFLMRGQGPTDQPAAEPTQTEITRTVEAKTPLALSQEIEPPAKRSLDSLFERAGAATAAIPDSSLESTGEPLVPLTPPDTAASLPHKPITRSDRTLERQGARDVRDGIVASPQAQIPEEMVEALVGVREKRRLNRGEFKVLMALALACREADSDRCYVKIAQLMADAELKERHTQMMLRSLQRLGLIERISEYSNLDRLGTQYRIRFDIF